MRDTGRKLPIGIQDFEGLIRDGYLYVDKTEYIHRLIHSGKQYFLSRPRRFGKSLLLSTMAAYWEGRKELFQGLAIDGLEGSEEDSWQAHPVFYFDFNGKNYQEKDGRGEPKLEEKLDQMLRDWEELYGDKYHDRSIEERFVRLLSMAHEQTGRRCVVLIDEYDKPLLDAMQDERQEEHYKAVFKGFFSNLKSLDKDIQFVFITGVMKFSKVSVFSDLNQLLDISLNDDYSAICGITETELRNNFAPEVEEMMNRQRLSEEECLEKLKRTYDGYRFSGDGEAVYNPYSLFSSFYNKKFGAYWFETGTPTFLVKKLRQLNYDVQQFSNESLFATEKRLSTYRAGGVGEDDGKNEDIIPLLYQTGYLTLERYNATDDYYQLGFPNEEVKYAFLDSLIPEYAPAVNTRSGKDIISIRRYLESGDLDSVRDALTALYASITYTSRDQTYEHYFQTVIYLVFELLNQYVHTEVHSLRGRADCIVETAKYIYLFEFKRDGTADEALRQIGTCGYALPYAADQRKLFKIGVSFDTEIRNISEWKVEG